MRPTQRIGQLPLDFDAQRPRATAAPPVAAPSPPTIAPAPQREPAPPATPEREWMEPGRTSALDLDFWGFHEANPAVYEALAKLARSALGRGKRRIGAKALWEVVRWDMWLATEGDEEFNLNNNYTSRYARLLMAREVDLRGVFVLRELRS